MNKENLRIVQVPINKLKPANYNPRQMDAKQEADLTASIKQFGLIDPIIANSNKDRLNIVVGGHQRLKVVQKLGYKEVPVVYLNLSEAKEKILNLRLNKNTGSWSFELLKNFEIGTLLDIGFDTEEIGMIWNDVLEIEDDEFNEEQELEKIKTTDIKLGNLFAL